MSTLNVSHGGRSTSQISIYDYPEHLNPFYEDENHKRIRFWHIGKYRNNNNNYGENSRRGSFSLSGLKEMWAFKSFRLKKKPSSLGINKTSESPPPLRRELTSDTNHYGTYDPRMRHTLNDNFLRGAPYRASLQDMRYSQKIEKNNNDNSGLGFERNNRYRSTIQTTMLRNQQSPINSNGLSPKAPPRRYVYGGSLTPQPRLRSSDYDEDYNNGISRGSSQMSIASKNPFEEDDDDEVVIRKVSSSESNTLDNRKRHIKKKRRAPPPPIPIPKVIDEESRVVENGQDDQEESAQITNLAVEIQNFVKSVDKQAEDNDSTKNVEDSVRKIEENREDSLSITTTHENQQNVKDQNKVDDSKKNEEIQPLAQPSHAEQESTFNGNLPMVDSARINDNFIEKLNIIEEQVNKVTSESPCHNNNNNNENELTEETSKAIEEEVVAPPSISTDFGSVELKITESVEDLSEKSQKSEISNEIVKEIEYVPLKDEEEIKEINSIIHNENNNNNSEEVQPIRRRSVRDIIESINRNQKLLKVNQSDNNIDTDNDLDKNHIQAPPRRKNNSKGIERIQQDDNEISNNAEETKSNEDYIISSGILQKLNDKINNNSNENECEIFKKCEIKKNIERESSPISSNLDWNPVPKPKRTKKISIDLQKYNEKVDNESKN